MTDEQPLVQVDVLLRTWVPAEKQNDLRAAINAALTAVRENEREVLIEIWQALNVRWRDVIPNDQFEQANRQFNHDLTQILETFRNICTGHGIDIQAAAEIRSRKG